MKFCPNCGSKMENTDVFCTNCGSRFPDTPVQSVQSSEPTQAAPVNDDGPLPILTEFPAEKPVTQTPIPTTVAAPAPAKEQQAAPQPTDVDIAAGILLQEGSIPDYKAALDALRQAVEAGSDDRRIAQLVALAQVYSTADMLQKSIQKEDISAWL